MAKGGIPTVGARGVRFRSRVEATWAAVFEALGLAWEYEPYDLEGYIPDFALVFGGEDGPVEVLVEVKHSMTVWSARTHAPFVRKARDAGWAGPLLVLGATHRPLPNGGGVSR